MGMAASQGRLLALTARMHDIELRAQYLESQKLSLATQQDAAYQKYCDALDATKIQVGRFDALGTRGISYVDANFNSVMGYHPLNCTQYSMINNITGKVIVSPEIKDLYERYSGDKYSFAWAAMEPSYEGQFGWSWTSTNDTPYHGAFDFFDNNGGAQCVGINNPSLENMSPGVIASITDPDGNIYYSGYLADTNGDGTNDISDLYMTEVEFAVFSQHLDDAELLEAYNNLYNASSSNPPASVNERRELYNEFKNKFYTKYGQDILVAMNHNKNYSYDDYVNDPTINVDPNYLENTTWNNVAFQKEFNYYINLWEQITAAGGCEAMESQYASGATGTEWFTNMVTSGQVSLYMLDNEGWQITTIATSIGDNYLQEVNDEAKAKKAEVEYEHELDIINRKDTKFDLQLKKLETEENACKTELDSLKQVKNDNIERTFNLFS